LLPKVCIDKFVDPDVADWHAVRENPENQIILPTPPIVGTHSKDLRAAGVILTGRKWPNGKVLKVAHMGGDPTVMRRVEETAMKWMKYVNLKLEFVGDYRQADVRIAYNKDDGSWSYLGTSIASIPREEPTMNYGWLEPTTSQTEYDRVVLHEFGHTWGYPHEHSHPRNDIPWDKPACYEYYRRTQGWTSEDVDQQVFFRYSESQTQFSEFDKRSIMLYSIPNALTIGDYEVGWNVDLSEGDIAFAAWQYPKDVVQPPAPPPKPVEPQLVTVSAPALGANPSKYYGKKLAIVTGSGSKRVKRWDANPT
jgi:serralysin